MTEYSAGGIVGGSVWLTMVPEVRPPVGGARHIVYADECFISSDGVCRRSDKWHRAVDVTPGFWTCLVHPNAAS